MERSSLPVALMTWYTYRNYGSALQASALYRVVKSLGYAPQMIRHLPKGDALTQQTKLWQPYFKKIHRLFNRAHRTVITPQQEALFADYLAQRVTETPLCNTYHDLFALNRDFAAFVCGSDQIWSPTCFDENYFLSFVEDDRKRVAYAPSLGMMRLEHPDAAPQMAAQISRFSHLSVREVQGAAIIRDLTGQQATVVADPTLLLTAADWDEYAAVAGCNTLPGDYILCYFLGDARRYAGYVKRLSQKTGLPAYVIPVTAAQHADPSAVPFGVGPREFVSLIRGAKHVCTDSFHGMAFSVNYRVPFTVFKRFADNDPKNQNSRILSLLDRLQLSHRLTDPKGALLPVACDFSVAEQPLAQLREASLDFLKASLAAATAVTTPALNTPVEITRLCCGCGACAAVCPTDAITISQNAAGFDSYAIDPVKCVRCGKCRSVCPMREPKALPLRESAGLYAVKSNTPATLTVSSSGGVGHELATAAMAAGYHVAGCVYDAAARRARHLLLAPGEEARLPAFQGSKYIQSATADLLRQLAALPAETPLAVFGTPCVIAGVDKLLTRLGRRDNALLVDLICHGVPSAHLFNAYLDERDKRCGTGTTPEVTFRYKAKGWRNMTMRVAGNGRSYVCHEDKDGFYAFFRNSLSYMDSCFECPYREASAADIRIGDYWGNRFVADTTGVSMVLPCTARGEAWLQRVAPACKIEDQALEEYWSVQFPYNPKKPVFNARLIADLREGKRSFAAIRRAYCRSYDMRRRVMKLVRKLKSLLR